MKNLIQEHFSAAEQTQFDDLLEQMEALLVKKLAALNEGERSKYGSVNEQNKLVINKVRDFRQNNPNMSTPDVDWDEFERDYQSRAFMESRSDRLASLVYRMQSTKILHDYDNYNDALTDYAYSQYKKGAGESGYTEKVAQIKQFFPKSGKTAPPVENNNG